MNPGGNGQFAMGISRPAGLRQLDHGVSEKPLSGCSRSRESPHGEVRGETESVWSLGIS